MLLGEHEHSLDDKNRLTLPAKLREQLGDHVVITRGMDGCLYVYARGAWDALAARIGSLDSLSADTRRMQRHFFVNATAGRARQAGAGRDPGAAARARGHRPRGHRDRRRRPPRDLGSRRVGASSCKRAKGAQRMLPSVLPIETDHVPVLAEEVLAVLAPRPGETVIDCTFGAGGHAALLAERLHGEGKLIAIDRDPSVAPYFERLQRAERASRCGCSRGEFSTVLGQLAANGVGADAILLDLGVSSMQLDRPERGFSYAADAPLDMRMDPVRRADRARVRQRGRRARARRRLPPLRRGALRAADRARDRPPPRQAAVRAHGRPRRDDQAGDPRAGALRRGPSGQARLPGAADRGQRRARLARARAAVGARDPAAGRPARGDLVPLARGPDREALPALAGARLHVPARLPALRVRRAAGVAGDAAPRDPALTAPRSPATRARSRRGSAWGSRHDELVLGSGRRAGAAHAHRGPPRSRSRSRRAKPRAKAKRRSRPRGAIAWIVISAIVLAGVVFVNLAVLRLNLAARQRDAGALEAPRRERDARVAALELARLAADPVARAPRRTASSTPIRPPSATST